MVLHVRVPGRGGPPRAACEPANPGGESRDAHRGRTKRAEAPRARNPVTAHPALARLRAAAVLDGRHGPFAGFLRLVADARSRIREVTVADVERLRHSGARFELIDVREEEEWQRGHVPGARHLSKGIIERDIEKAVRIVTPTSSSTAAGVSLHAGRRQPAEDGLHPRRVDGRWVARWTGAGLPVVREA